MSLVKWVCVSAELRGKTTFFSNRDNDLVSFYHAVLQTIIEIDFDSIENIIFGGDFNCPLNPAGDKRSGNISPRRSVIAAIEQIQSKKKI